MRHIRLHSFISLFVATIFVFTTFSSSAQTKPLNLEWIPREDLNIQLPASVRIYETNGVLQDGANVRAMYATIDLRDKNLKLHAVGSNKLRETTLDAYRRTHAILAINGGYFSSTKSESLLVSDGELIAPGPTNVTRAAFGLVNRRPEIVWPFAIDSLQAIFKVNAPTELKKNSKPNPRTTSPWHPAQAMGGGPMLVKEGKIRDGSKEEGFGASHLLRHPRTAIGYRDEHTILMMIVDGRQQSSAGVTITELAQMMLEAGCYEAVNLDGGGSSAMIAAGEIVNVPVDIPNGNRHSLRKNASALVVTEGVPSIEKKVIIIDTEDKAYSEQGVWQSTNHANYYGNSASRQSIANKDNKAVFRFSPITSGNFQLSAWWTVHDQNTNRATYVLHHGNKIDSIHVDQTRIASNGRWNVLGNFYLAKDDYLEAIATTDGKLVTDAIRLVTTDVTAEQPRRGDLRIAVISDLNSGLGSASYEWQVDSIVQRIPRIWQPDLVLCGGDMVAGMGVSDTTTLNKMWRAFDERIALPLRRKNIPFAFTIGNHDGLRSYPTERDALSKYWAHADHKTGLTFVDQTHFPHYYSFTAGETFIISWDASSSEITKENLQWVEQQLQRDEAKKAQARFVMGHLPMYSVAQERDSKGNLLNDGDGLRKLLEKYDVKVYVSGHQHAYYPGKRGALELLNTGAAGSGPRRWLTTDKAPVNTITIMDVFYEKDTITYTTYDIKHREASQMTLFDHRQLPASISGVNGFLIRKDINVSNDLHGIFYPAAPYVVPTTPLGTVNISIENNTITVSGSLNLPGVKQKADAISFREKNPNGEGTVIYNINHKSKGSQPTFRQSFTMTEEMLEQLAVGKYFIEVRSGKNIYRAQLYPKTNSQPAVSSITSHNSKNVYGVRDTNGLYQITWTPSFDADGDRISYFYQLAEDSLFKRPLLELATDGTPSFKTRESSIFALLKDNKKVAFYHRVITTDGLHAVIGKTSSVQFVRSSEQPYDFVELEASLFVLDGKIDNASGQGSGAAWDKNGKLWLADYGGSLFVNEADGKAASFSPIRTLTINNQSYPLRPVNGISLDRDGNILVGSNRHLFKIDASTGAGIAVWEVPEGKRSITTPRVNDKGEIYAMSLFAEDPNYVLKQSTTNPETFDLVRTINLPQRILTRTFDMTDDGLTLYFPDPGAPLIQVYKSTDGINYKRSTDITSVEAGCNAIRVTEQMLFAAVRSSGISPSTLHFRDEKQKVMWTLPLPELNGAEARGIAVSPDLQTIIICSWDNSGGFYRYRRVKR